jgi:hypothetical protein
LRVFTLRFLSGFLASSCRAVLILVSVFVMVTAGVQHAGGLAMAFTRSILMESGMFFKVMSWPPADSGFQ